MAVAVEMLNISKFYPGVIANDKVSLSVNEGEILGLIGENGAGKSTMMNMLYGMTAPDEGVIRLFGKEVHIQSPNMAIKLGIGMVHQHFMLMPNLSVLQNIILGNTPTKHGLIDEKQAKNKIKKIMETYDLPVSLDEKVYQLSVGEKQRVEIIKALYRDAKILILDEPTAVLTPQETDKLLEVMQELKKQGCAIVFITHKLREVMAITDEIVVMRKGVVTGSLSTSEANTGGLSDMIVGRTVNLDIPRGDYCPGETVLEVQNIYARNQRGLPALNGVNFKVAKGEIVGIAGVEGNGQAELIDTISGMIYPTDGKIILEGEDVTEKNVRQRREDGMAHIPEDRLGMGTAVSCSIRDNLILNRYYQKPYCKNGIMNNKKLHQLSERLCKDFGVKTPDSTYKLGTLSGGNMQKVVFAREMEANPEFLIAAQPTRGVDIGAIESIHHKIMEVRDSGRGVLLISAELDEIFSLSDRILVMYEGEIVAEFKRGEVDERTIGTYMTGAKRQGDKNGEK
ncbi:MAG: ABC transporter ATP-binding protein [Hespellia sp.]|nr:ABC transporter ATP-binding protein [Hespellia sp.]